MKRRSNIPKNIKSRHKFDFKATARNRVGRGMSQKRVKGKRQ